MLNEYIDSLAQDLEKGRIMYVCMYVCVRVSVCVCVGLLVIDRAC